MEVFETGTIDAAAKVLRALKTKCKFRQKILDCLDGCELTVSEIMERTKFEQSVASQHLAILRGEGIVKYEKNGKFHVYKINEKRIKEIEDACETLARMPKEVKDEAQDNSVHVLYGVAAKAKKPIHVQMTGRGKRPDADWGK